MRISRQSMRVSRRDFEELYALARVEVQLSYRIPLLEGIVAVFVFLVLLSVMVSMTNGPGIGGWVPGNPFYNRTELLIKYSEFINLAATGSFALTQTYCWTICTILVPLFFASTLAMSFEDSTLRTLLSYPVSRSRLLLSRLLMFLTVLLLPAFTVPLLMIIVLLPPGAIINHLVLLCVASALSLGMICASSVLLSVILWSASSMSMVGVFMWIGVSYLTQTTYYNPRLNYLVPVNLRLLLNPIMVVSEYAYAMGEHPELAFSDIVFGLLGSLVILLVLVIAALMVFRRAEI